MFAHSWFKSPDQMFYLWIFYFLMLCHSVIFAYPSLFVKRICACWLHLHISKESLILSVEELHEADDLLLNAMKENHSSSVSLKLIKLHIYISHIQFQAISTTEMSFLERQQCRQVGVCLCACVWVGGF